MSRARVLKRFRSPGSDYARLLRLAKSIPWNRFLSFSNV
jgi:hypothetical protein